MLRGVEDELTPLGRLLEQARGRVSKREAARRADISEGHWRAVVRGYQLQAGVKIPANPRRDTVIAMALAVGVEPSAALEAAGFDPTQAPETPAPVGAGVDPDLLADIAEATPATIEAVRAVLRAAKGG